jgi:hypothetical protein
MHGAGFLMWASTSQERPETNLARLTFEIATERLHDVSVRSDLKSLRAPKSKSTASFVFGPLALALTMPTSRNIPELDKPAHWCETQPALPRQLTHLPPPF